MAKVAPVTDIDISMEEMIKHVARFKEQKSTAKSFIDTRIPGHEREIFSIIGQSTMEDSGPSPDYSGARFPLFDHQGRCRQGRGAALASYARSLHAADRTVEHLLGPGGQQGGHSRTLRRDLRPYSRDARIRNAGHETALLLAVVGGHDPGKVGWPDTMKRLARAAGLELTEDGTFREIAAAH